MSKFHPTLNYVLTPEDKLHICPYNKSHQVLAPRLCRHLIICRKAYLKKCGSEEPDIQICRWNTNHHYPKSEMKIHLEECPDRECMIEFTKYHEDPNFKLPGPSKSEPEPGCSKVKSQKKVDPRPLLDVLNDEVEDWEPKARPVEVTYAENLEGPKAPEEQEAPSTAYDPAKKLQREPIIYTPQGLTKSELKAHRKKEHERWKKLNLHEMIVQVPKPAQEASGAASVVDDDDFDSDASFPDTDPEDEADDDLADDE